VTRRHGRGSAGRGDREYLRVDSLRLVERIQSGETHLTTVLYERYFNKLYRYLYSQLSENEVEDALQHVFLEVVQTLPRYRVGPTSSFEGWLFAIARNVAHDERGRRDTAILTAPEELRRELEVQGAAGATDHKSLPGWGSDSQILTALRGLNEASREIILLHYAADLGFEDIATAMGLSAAATRKAHYRALDSLRDRLSALGSGGLRRRPPLAMRSLAGSPRVAWMHSFSSVRT
jgi:RNA polymerase sigma-70 factor (ECF subfamily)